MGAISRITEKLEAILGRIGKLGCRKAGCTYTAFRIKNDVIRGKESGTGW